VWALATKWPRTWRTERANRRKVAPPEADRETTATEEGTERERSLGLGGGVAIDVGATIGAETFVFPGFAAGRAGPAAAGSFAIGALIALVVGPCQLPNSPPRCSRSGGGYYLILRALGALPGAVLLAGVLGQVLLGREAAVGGFKERGGGHVRKHPAPGEAAAVVAVAVPAVVGVFGLGPEFQAVP